MSHGAVDATERPTVKETSRPRARGRLVSKNDLLPLMALFGAIYGWVLIVVTAVVALVFVLVS